MRNKIEEKIEQKINELEEEIGNTSNSHEFCKLLKARETLQEVLKWIEETQQTQPLIFQVSTTNINDLNRIREAIIDMKGENIIVPKIDYISKKQFDEFVEKLKEELESIYFTISEDCNKRLRELVKIRIDKLARWGNEYL